MQYGLNIENQNLIIDKAATKKDGVYSFRGVVYRVRDKKVTHFADGTRLNGEILQGYGHFNVVVGRFESGMGWEARVKKIFKDIK